jgi:hypothetical protein
MDLDSSTGFVSPWRPPVPLLGASSTRMGLFKYLRSRHAAPGGSGRFTVWYWDVDSDDRWLSLSNNTNTNGRMLIPWNKEVEP